MDGSLYQFHGLTVDCIDKTDPNSEERRAAYGCDITFGTNNEFGFDYLRNDNMATQTQDLVQREEHYYAIVDEVDSVLIDDARTPLIISGPIPKGMIRCSTSSSPMWRRWSTPSANSPSSFCSKPRRKISAGNTEDGGFVAVPRLQRRSPSTPPLIRYLSEDGIKQLMLKVEAKYMADNNREMPKAVEPLFFVIDEKNHSIELTDKGYRGAL